jgi:hypothetical protein
MENPELLQILSLNFIESVTQDLHHYCMRFSEGHHRSHSFSICAGETFFSISSNAIHFPTLMLTFLG